MDLRLLAAISGELDGVNVAALCRANGISRKTFYKWRDRYKHAGLTGLEARSRRPHRSPQQMPSHVEDLIVEQRKWLLDYGLDAGAASIRHHLEGRVSPVPSDATIWRALVRRGQITPAPRKRPRSSYLRWEAPTPNECWQIDVTEWAMANATAAIVNIIDDHSRLAIASHACQRATSELAWTVFDTATRRWGIPASCLSDNGLAFTGRVRGFEVLFEANLRSVGVAKIDARPYHPQTCGKVERFQQTLKRWLRARRRSGDLAELQAQLDEFCHYYNTQRPHRGIGRLTPLARFTANPASGAGAALPPRPITKPARLHHIRLTRHGFARAGRWLIGLGVEYAGQPADVLIDGLHAEVRINGSVIRSLTLDPSRSYQPTGKRPGPRRKDGS